MMRRVFSIAVLPLLLGAVPPSAAPADDRVLAFGATSTCRTMFGTIIHRVGRRDGDAITVAVTEKPPTGNAVNYVDRFTFDRGSATWHVRFGAESIAAGEGSAPAWTTPAWNIEVHGADAPGRIRYQMLDGGDVRRTTEQPLADHSTLWRVVDAELCTPGDVPPPPDACVAENFPPYVRSYGTPTVRVSRAQTGVVRIVVGLDAQSQIVSTQVLSTPNPRYNDYALETVRLSTFQTEIRNCQPVANRYVFDVYFD